MPLARGVVTLLPRPGCAWMITDRLFVMRRHSGHAPEGGRTLSTLEKRKRTSAWNNCKMRFRGKLQIKSGVKAGDADPDVRLQLGLDAQRRESAQAMQVALAALVTLLPRGVRATEFLWFWESFLEPQIEQAHKKWYEWVEFGIPIELEPAEGKRSCLCRRQTYLSIEVTAGCWIRVS